MFVFAILDQNLDGSGGPNNSVFEFPAHAEKYGGLWKAC